MITVGAEKIKLYKGNIKIKKAYLGTTKIYSAGSIVTYRVDSNAAYTEEVEEGASCLSPQTFAPSKSGWTFVGWRADTTASGSVLTSKIMGDAPITLYAVFRQTVTLSYNGNSATGGSTAAQTGTRYYNNGYVANPSFTLAANGFTRSNYLFYRWAMGSAGGTQYAPGAVVTLAASTVFYAYWATTVANTYAYNASAYTFTAPYTGIYQLECSGGAGGTVAGIAGGAGGYAKGSIALSAGDVLTINVGANSNRTAGNSYTFDDENTYSGTNYIGAGGFEAKIYKNGVLAIAAGGGGGGYYGSDGHNIVSYTGGAGGGTTGGNGVGSSTATGGSQTAQGKDCPPVQGLAIMGYGGAGGGYFRGGQGGFVQKDRRYGTPGAGGSGYVGGVTGGTMASGYNSGNPSAKITLVSII